MTVSYGDSQVNNNELSHLIINYLKRNPDACDNLEGIAGWWLQFERIEYTVDEVLSVLDDLVNRGLIVRQEVKGAGSCYRVVKKDKDVSGADCYK